MSTFEKLALFDLDGTLINDTYQPTDPAIGEAVQAAQEADWAIGLNSDTPYEALCTWRTRFAMNGPIIAEKGAVVEGTDGLIFDECDAVAVLAARERVADYAYTKGIDLWQGNATEALRNGLTHDQPGRTLILLNNLSRCSLRFFVRIVQEDGRLSIDDARTQQVIADCRPLLPAFDELSEDNNPAFGLFIASRAGITKRHGTQVLLRATGIGRCVMVGNAMSDYLGSDIADHYAVSNADLEYQNVATTLPEPVTKGCIAMLWQLAADLRG
jgi:haloacid dehalogenase-like hydrolase